MKIKENALLLSTDSLPNYWLDLVFSIAKSVGFDWIDLAMWKWFDAWDEDYVQKLALDHDIPVYVIQTSSKLNQRELDKALDICSTTNADTICINAPKITDFKAYDFISANLKQYKGTNPDIHFTIINPKDSKFFALLPEYRFNNIIDIVRKYDAFVWLDVYNMDIDSFENDLTRKIDDYIPYISVIYLSDKTKDNKSRLIPWDGTLDLQTFLRRLKKWWYRRPISVKIDFKPTDLANRDKLKKYLKKVKMYYDKYFMEADLSDGDLLLDEKPTIKMEVPLDVEDQNNEQQQKNDDFNQKTEDDHLNNDKEKILKEKSEEEKDRE